VDLFEGIRFLDLVPDLMRQPAFPGQTILGDSGENLPTVLQAICANPDRKAVMMDWVRELTPMDVSDFEFPRDPITGLVQLAIREGNGSLVSAYSASDGTLRFLAMLAALLGEHPARVFFFEEIDNGIHPSRLRLLLDLIERQTAKRNIQVVTTTHSPDLLAMISDATFENASVVHRSPGAAGAVIRRIADLPDARRLRASQGLGRLHASGWMEDMLNLEDIPDAAE
jgi:predicted ATPase